MTLLITLLELVLLIILILFVYRVVGQMHEQVGQVGLSWRLVLISRQSTKTLLEEVHSQGIKPAYHYVDAQVILQSINQVRLVQIALNDIVLRGQDIL